MSVTQYSSISIDTSSLQNSRFNFSGPLLSQLTQFIGTEISVIQSDIVHRESVLHLTDELKNNTESIRKALDVLETHAAIPETVFQTVKLHVSNEVDCNKIAESRLKEFYSAIGAQVIKSSDHVNTDRLVDMYFMNKAPFENSKKKKNEFPDALALLSLLNWAEDNKENMVVVSSDAGWESFSENTDGRLKVFKDISKALEFFQPYRDVEKIKESIIQSGILFNEEIKEEIHTVGNAVARSFYVIADAESDYGYDLEYENIEFIEFAYNVFDEDDDSVEMDVLQINDDSIEISIPIFATCSIEAGFNLFTKDSFDPNYVPMGSAHKYGEINLDARVYITITGRFSDAFNSADLNIDDVEYNNFPHLHINFDFIEPDSDSEFDVNL